MTKLEQQIYHELSYNTDGGNLLESEKVEEMARIAAKIALELAQDAYGQGVADQCTYEHGGGSRTFKQFIQDYE